MPRDSKESEWIISGSFKSLSNQAIDISVENYIANTYLKSLPGVFGGSITTQHVPFKISRKALKSYLRVNADALRIDANLDIKHSYLAIPDADGRITLAAVMRGKLEGEGIVGHGIAGKVLNVDLVVDGSQYCVKVLPDSKDARHEHEVAKHLALHGIKKPQWYFTRSEEQRQQDKDEKIDSRWIYRGEIRHKAYIIQEQISGVPCAELFDENNESIFLNNEFFRIRIALSMAQELKKMHDVGVVHGDLNLGNILIKNINDDKKARTEIIDFGLSKIYDNMSSEDFKQAVSDDLAQLGTNFKDLGISDEFVKDLRMKWGVGLDEVIEKLSAKLAQHGKLRI